MLRFAEKILVYFLELPQKGKRLSMRIDYKIRFTKGVLVGIEIDQFLNFPDMLSLKLWLAGVKKNSKANKLNYELLSYTVN